VWLRFIKLVVKICLYPRIALRFLLGRADGGNRVGLSTKVGLFLHGLRNAVIIPRESSFFEHLTLMSAVLAIPNELPGDIAEFGCYKGGATASLSLACAAMGRRLIVFDSFRGLPTPQEVVENIGSGKILHYQTGDFLGTLAEVKANVARGGCLQPCTFVEGFFDETLRTRPADERYAMIFEDADLPESVRAVLINAWPRLAPGGIYYCHEALDYQVVQMFFDRSWWKDNLGCKPPGFVGSGIGLPLEPNGRCCLGYAIKPKAV
jgi:O-methyltransferase